MLSPRPWGGKTEVVTELPEEGRVELQARQVPPGTIQIQNHPVRLRSHRSLPSRGRPSRSPEAPLVSSWAILPRAARLGA